jgi:mono/diheme cytochrome c family protein
MKQAWLFAGAVLALAASAGLGVGCGGTGDLTITGGTGGSTGSSGTGASESGLPCNVYDVLNNDCGSCHGSPLAGGATVPLLSYAALTAKSPTQPTLTVAEVAVQRMQNGTMPPKPAAMVAAADIQVVADWVSGGMQMGTCGGGDGGTDPTFTGPSTCQSNSYAPNDPDQYTDPQRRDMMPGQACIKCHLQNQEGFDGPPIFTIAGTVFDTGHVPDNCKPPATVDLTQAQVVITDKNGAVITLTPRALSGNFYTEQPVATPYTAKVVYKGQERKMATPQTSGDCNGCHTDAGTNTTPGAAPAPGRIALPYIP